MPMVLKLSRDVVLNRAFNRDHVLARGHARAVAEPENMGINRLGGLFEPHIQNHIRGFAAHPRQALQSRAG